MYLKKIKKNNFNPKFVKKKKNKKLIELKRLEIISITMVKHKIFNILV